MDQKLKKYNEQNAYLGFMVEDLRGRQEQIQALIKKNKDIIRANEQFINGFKNAVFWTTKYTDDPQQLKIAVQQFLYPYIKNKEPKNGDINPEIKKEYEQQKKFLENSMASLKKRVEIESEIHKQDNQKSMNDNFMLIKQIMEMRKKVKDLEKKHGDSKTKRAELEKQVKNMGSADSMDTENDALVRRLKRNTDDDDEI